MIKNVEEHVDMMMIIHQTEKEHLHLPTVISRHTVRFAAMIETTGSRIKMTRMWTYIPFNWRISFSQIKQG